jgi:hypothetical protein
MEHLQDEIIKYEHVLVYLLSFFWIQMLSDTLN